MTIITNYCVRPIEEQDIPFLWEMLYASLHRREGDFGYVAVDQQGKRLGSITLRFYTDQNAGYGYVNAATPEMGMAVTEDARGKGIGTLLLQTALDEVERRGIAAVSLSVDPDNQAFRLYKRLGFVEESLNGTSVTMVRVSKLES